MAIDNIKWNLIRYFSFVTTIPCCCQNKENKKYENIMEWNCANDNTLHLLKGVIRWLCMMLCYAMPLYMFGLVYSV